MKPHFMIQILQKQIIEPGISLLRTLKLSVLHNSAFPKTCLNLTCGQAKYTAISAIKQHY